MRVVVDNPLQKIWTIALALRLIYTVSPARSGGLARQAGTGVSDSVSVSDLRVLERQR